ncbi:carbohydrate kinase [Jannaschia sp. Os4]|uniref:carbohydrate kinase family protein n=1 Tax=Jannaschia sp. Os4 TaxID=2807617 RepID=UPI00193A5898|nr:carbohydrate kinase [Jannaschia sp. Os4]MBM2577790.1 carbohydrate kinase [Jannaschia sp. Os4]
MILCAGEALIDMLPRETADGPGFYPAVGGAVLNTAVALGRLGAPVAMHTGLSTDLFGDLIAARMAESGVEDRAARADRPTTLAFVKLTDGQAEYAFYDENTAGRLLSPEDAPSLDGIDTLFLGGISLAVEPCADTYEVLAASTDLPLMIDPNVRPGFVADAERYRARIRRLLARASVVKLSDEDMDWLGTTPAEVLALGPHTICLTEGAKGATAITARGEVRVPARKVEVVDTVGAGDTFNAGVLAVLAEAGLGEPPSDETLRAALDLGVAAAAVTVSRAGANPPRRDEL